MKRRDFIKLIGAASVAPSVALAVPKPETRAGGTLLRKVKFKKGFVRSDNLWYVEHRCTWDLPYELEDLNIIRLNGDEGSVVFEVRLASEGLAAERRNSAASSERKRLRRIRKSQKRRDKKAQLKLVRRER
jgi:hypothetical protein